MLPLLLLVAASVNLINGHGVATSSQSMVSGEGWRYSYGIAHGPPGIGHAVGESFPHGYGGFGTYAPGFGYHLVPPVPLPPRPVVVKLPPTYIYPRPTFTLPGTLVPKVPPVVVTEPVRPIVVTETLRPPVIYPKPIQYVRPSPYVYSPYYPHHHHEPYYYLDDHDDHDHHGHLSHVTSPYSDLFDHHH